MAKFVTAQPMFALSYHYIFLIICNIFPCELGMLWIWGGRKWVNGCGIKGSILQFWLLALVILFYLYSLALVCSKQTILAHSDLSPLQGERTAAKGVCGHDPYPHLRGSSCSVRSDRRYHPLLSRWPISCRLEGVREMHTTHGSLYSKCSFSR